MLLRRSLNRLIADWYSAADRGSAEATLSPDQIAMVRGLAKQLDNLVASFPALPIPPWQPATSAPSKTFVFVCWDDKPEWHPCVLRMTDEGWENEDGHQYRTPSHWMPLPEPVHV